MGKLILFDIDGTLIQTSKGNTGLSAGIKSFIEAIKSVYDVDVTQIIKNLDNVKTIGVATGAYKKDELSDADYILDNLKNAENFLK